MNARTGVKLESSELAFSLERLLKAILVTLCVTALWHTATVRFFEVYSKTLYEWRQPRTEFAFLPPVSVPTLCICVALGTLAVYKRSSIVPLLLMGAFTRMTFYVMAWSGPGDLLNAIEPLITLRLVLPWVTILLTGITLAAWISFSSSGSQFRISRRGGKTTENLQRPDSIGNI